MAVRGNIVGIDSPEALEKALRSAYYLADEGLATAAYLALALGKPLLLEGSPGVGKTEAAKAIARGAGAAAHPPAVLRRHRRFGGALRMELSPPDAGDPAGRRAEHRHLRRALSDREADARGAALARFDGAAHRRDRSLRSGIRGVSARVPVRFPDFDSRARDGARGRSGRSLFSPPIARATCTRR